MSTLCFTNKCSEIDVLAVILLLFNISFTGFPFPLEFLEGKYRFFVPIVFFFGFCCLIFVYSFDFLLQVSLFP